VLDGTPPTDPNMSGGGIDLSVIQKVFEDKPLAMTARLYGETLVIGNVRLPAGVENMAGACYSLTVLGGRYTLLGDKPVPKPKPMKMPTAPQAVYVPPPVASYGYPVPAGTTGYPVTPSTYNGPTPTPYQPAPLGSYGSPGYPITPSTYNGPAPTPCPQPGGYVPAGGAEPSLPPLPQELPCPTPGTKPPSYAPTPPIPPAVEDEPKPKKKGKKKQTPDERMEELLRQSEDLRQHENAWRRGSTFDQPSKLTPERVHGPIQ
jgi:hypothetical protein